MEIAGQTAGVAYFFAAALALAAGALALAAAPLALAAGALAFIGAPPACDAACAEKEMAAKAARVRTETSLFIGAVLSEEWV